MPNLVTAYIQPDTGIPNGNVSRIATPLASFTIKLIASALSQSSEGPVLLLDRDGCHQPDFGAFDG